MRFTNIKCLTGYLFLFDVIVIVYSIRFIAFTITSSFASLTGYSAPFSRSLASHGSVLTHTFLSIHYPISFLRFKDSRLNDEKRTHTLGTPTTIAEAHAAIRVNKLDTRSIFSRWCLIRCCKPIRHVN